jgi:hypothetical protein
MKQVFAKSMLLSATFFFLFCQRGAAQLGIGTTNPNGLLDVTSATPATPGNTDGFLAPRVSNFPATNPGINQNGMLIYLTATVNGNNPGFYYWEQSSVSWKRFFTTATASAATPVGYSTPLVSTTGGGNLVFNAGGWFDNTLTTLSLNEVSDVSGINTGGTITIAQSGLYYITAITTLGNNPSTGTFDGTSGTFQTQLQVQPTGAAAFVNVNQVQVTVLRGPDQSYPLNNTALLNLQTGDQVRIQFMTTSTNNMNNNTSNLIINRNQSSMKLIKF